MASVQSEEEFSKNRDGLESEVTELEKKIRQERERAEQQIRVKELELAGLNKTLEQKDLQRNASMDARQKEIDQERTRLLDLVKELESRLEKERVMADKTLQAKGEELKVIRGKIRLQKEKFEEFCNYSSQPMACPENFLREHGNNVECKACECCVRLRSSKLFAAWFFPLKSCLK